MKRNYWVTTAVFFAASVVLVGCGGSGPASVVKSYFNAMNSGKYSEAIEYLTGGMKDLAKVDGGKGMSDEMTKNGTMSKLEIVSEEVRGEGATVKVRIHFKNGDVEDSPPISLIKQDGKWKITMGM